MTKAGGIRNHISNSTVWKASAFIRNLVEHNGKVSRPKYGSLLGSPHSDYKALYNKFNKYRAFFYLYWPYLFLLLIETIFYTVRS